LYFCGFNHFLSRFEFMKKTFAALLQDERLVGDEAFEALHQGYLSAKNLLKQAKTEQATAKQAYQDSVESGGQTPIAKLEQRTHYRQSKCMYEFHALGFELAKQKLYDWLETWHQGQS